MKYLKVDSEKCIGCHSCEEACSEMFFKEKNVSKANLLITEGTEGTFHITACSQCQKCMPLCQPKAITVNPAGVVVINKQDCIGCLICVAECPLKIMCYHETVKFPFKCIACGHCVSRCPVSALEIVKE